MHYSDELHVLVYRLFLSTVLKALYQQFKPYKIVEEIHVDTIWIKPCTYHKNQQNKYNLGIIYMYFKFICYLYVRIIVVNV